MSSNDEDLILWGLGGLGAFFLAWQQQGAIVDYFERGERLTVTKPDAFGVIRVAPAELVRQASAVMGRDIAPDMYAAARMLRSERGRNEPQPAMRLRLHVALNDLAAVRWADTLEELFTYSTYDSERGWYGDQTGRRYATTQDPYAGDVMLAESVTVEHEAGIDPTGGAVKFVDKASMGGVQAGTGSYDALVARWAPEGLRPFEIPGAPDGFVVFRRVG